MSACPHRNVLNCPLYSAAYEPDLGALGCDDGELGAGDCAVDRGMSYTAAFAQLEVRAPRLVAERRWAEQRDAIMAQRRRNCSAAGIKI